MVGRASEPGIVPTRISNDTGFGPRRVGGQGLDCRRLRALDSRSQVTYAAASNALKPCIGKHHDLCPSETV